jgi:hypothetical protein
VKKHVFGMGIFASSAFVLAQNRQVATPVAAGNGAATSSARIMPFTPTGGASSSSTVTTSAAPIEAADPVLTNGPVIPKNKGGSTSLQIAFNPVSAAVVQDIHLRPLYVTAIKLPHAVTTVAVGAPTLFDAEHKDEAPNLVFIKPSTHDPAESNLLIAMDNGETVSVRLISPGDFGSADNVDSVVNYNGTKSLFARRGGEPVVAVRNTASGTVGAAAMASPVPPLDAATALANQNEVATPQWFTAKDLTRMIRANALAPNNIAIAIGQIRQDGDEMTVSFSVLNVSDHWVLIMPPQVDLSNPLASKKDKKKNGTFAEPVRVTDYHLENPKLSPGARADGSVTIRKPESKLARESLLLHIATSASIDTPVYFPLPFVAPSTGAAAVNADKENPYGSR